MARITGPWIVLDDVEAERFHRNAATPDPEVMRRRDAFFAEIDQMHITELDDGSVEIDFPPKPRVDSSAFFSSEQGYLSAAPARTFFVSLKSLEIECKSTVGAVPITGTTDSLNAA